MDKGVEKGVWGEVWKGVFGKFVVYVGGSRICSKVVGGFLEGGKENIGRRR